MCGRFFRYQPRDELASAFRAELGVGHAGPAYNIAPGQPIVAVRFNPKTGKRTLDDLLWGLVPHFAADAKAGFRNVNARAETLDTTASFRTAFERHRCLIVADGFFEWQALGRRKQPYAIARKRGGPLALAGVWSNWRDPKTGDWLRSCAIVTTQANAQLADIHARMPAIVAPDDYARWLGEEPAETRELKALLKPYDAEPLAVWAVSPQMNKPSDFDGPLVLEPVDVTAPPSARADRQR